MKRLTLMALAAATLLSAQAHATPDTDGAALPFQQFSIRGLDRTLNPLARFVYPYKATLFRDLAEASQAAPSLGIAVDSKRAPEQLTLLLLLEPLINDIETEYFVKYVRPQLKRALERYTVVFGIPDITAVPAESTHRAVGLRVAAAGLRALEAFVSDLNEAQLVRDAVAEAGRALATGDTSGFVTLVHTAAFQALLDRLAFNGRTRGIAGMVAMATGVVRR